ncbi:TcpE family conjugal transfer membrane protein [Lysinibacillus fusiformis]|uniref:TcpE family conjugal transfer membrane protein n=1 Tax=Lysinibacillus fusiformis TaxID=28031 RepID=UPI002E23511C|nr:TcpE family conjugal transfer membrane protein [Lysinibacillus fusiformis]
MKEEEHYEYLYTLDSFLKFERKIYQFAGIPFGRPIRAKVLLYFIVIFAILLIWRNIPVLSIVISWIPIVILLVLSGVFAWLLADVGTEDRNPMKYFKSFFSYQYRRLRRISYYQGKEISKPKDYDVSGHITFCLPSNSLELNGLVAQKLSLEVSDCPLPPINETELQYKSPYDKLKYTKSEVAHVESVELPLAEVIEIEEVQTVELQKNAIQENKIEEVTELADENYGKLLYLKNDRQLQASGNLGTDMHFPAMTELSVIAPLEDEKYELASINNEEPLEEEKMNSFDFTPIVRNSSVETIEKIEELEDRILYLKVSEIKKMARSTDNQKDSKEHQNIIAKMIDKTIEAIERRKQVKRYKERNNKKKG